MRALLLMMLLLLAGFAPPAAAVEIPALMQVARTIPGPAQAQLSRERQVLARQLSTLKQRISRFNRDCASVVKGSAAASRCREQQGSLQHELQRYHAAATDFNRRVDMAASFTQRRKGSGQGSVSKLDGEVYVLTGRGKVPLWRHFELNPGDEIATGSNGYVELQLDDGSRIVLGPDSHFIADTLAHDYAFRLLRGKFKAWVKRVMSRRFMVRTPNVAVAVRGTRFSIDQHKERSVIQVSKGAVEAMPTGAGKPIVVRAGWRLLIDAGRVNLEKVR